MTSSAHNDSGMFETNLRDERLLPFEGAGAVSTWKLELPRQYRAFDYSTISDVVLHIRYTARQGVDPLKVKAFLDELFEQSERNGLALLLSLRYDFPTDWATFVNGTGVFAPRIGKEHFPYFCQGRLVNITGIDLLDATDISVRESIGEESQLANWSDTLNVNNSFNAEFPESPVLKQRDRDGAVFMILRYRLG